MGTSLQFPIGRSVQEPPPVPTGFVAYFAAGLNAEEAASSHKTAAVAGLVFLGILAAITLVGIPLYVWLWKRIGEVDLEGTESKKALEQFENYKHEMTQFVDALGGADRISAFPIFNWEPQRVNAWIQHGSEITDVSQTFTIDQLHAFEVGPASLGGFGQDGSVTKGQVGDRSFVMLRLKDTLTGELFTQMIAERNKEIGEGFKILPGKQNFIGRQCNVPFTETWRTFTAGTGDDYNSDLNEENLLALKQIMNNSHPRYKLTNEPMAPLALLDPVVA